MLHDAQMISRHHNTRRPRLAMEHLLMVAALLLLLSGCCQTSSEGHPSVEALYTPQVSAPSSPPNRPEPEDEARRDDDPRSPTPPSTSLTPAQQRRQMALEQRARRAQEGRRRALERQEAAQERRRQAQEARRQRAEERRRRLEERRLEREQNQGCCKICRRGCACGNSCISCDKECHKPFGCACDG